MIAQLSAQPGEAEESHNNRSHGKTNGKKGDRRNFAKAELVENKTAAPEQRGQNEKRWTLSWETLLAGFIAWRD